MALVNFIQNFQFVIYKKILDLVNKCLLSLEQSEMVNYFSYAKTILQKRGL